MGGRGTFAIGNSVSYSYKTVGSIGGIKVLQGVFGKHGLPEEAHSSGAYISLHPDGSVKQIRIFNPNLTAKLDVEYSMHHGEKVLHAHDYENGVRQPARDLSKVERATYEKFFGGNYDQGRV